MTNSPNPRVAHALRNELAALEHKLGPIEYRPLASLKRFENNPRKHPEKQLVKLTASLREFGFAMPVLVDEASTIIAGEARVEAARRAGMTEVPAIVAHQWSTGQVRAYRLADNRLAELSSWDADALAIELAAIIEFDDGPIEVVGWETAQIDLILDDASEDTTGEGSDPADEQLEPPPVAVTQPGDLWLLGKHRLLCGSSLDPENWDTLLDGDKAAMVFTDPPYNVLVSGHVCGLGKISHAEFPRASDEMSKAEFTTFLSTFIAAMMPHLKDGAVLDLCMDWQHLSELLSAIVGKGLSLLDTCIWNKSNGGMGSLYRSKHELVLIAKKGVAAHTNNVELGKHGRHRTNVWDYAGVNTIGKGRMTDLADHPTVKPTALVADAIRDVTNADEIVLDAFMGSGTTILACERTRRRGFGIELEPRYVDVAVRRWQRMSGEEAVLAESGEPFSALATHRLAKSAANASTLESPAPSALADTPA